MLRTEVLIHIHPEGRRPEGCICTISKTRASVSSGYPNTEKQMNKQMRCLDTPMKHEARVLEITSHA